jgi:hypothetical protein
MVLRGALLVLDGFLKRHAELKRAARRRRRQGYSREAEAWLRRQLKGLGKGGS